MGPKPVQISLKKKRKPSEVLSDLSDDPEDVRIPLSDSIMGILEEEAAELGHGVDSSTEVEMVEPTDVVAEFARAAEDELERDEDPDYVQPAPVVPVAPKKIRHVSEPVAGGSRKRKEVEMSPLKVQPKTRSDGPIWAFFLRDDKMINGVKSKAARCQVMVGGGKCNARLLQGDSTTSGLNSHLEKKHPKQWVMFLAAKANKAAIKAGANKVAHALFDKAEGIDGEKTLTLTEINRLIYRLLPFNIGSNCTCSMNLSLITVQYWF